jgi:hypothetical protein
MCQRTIRLIVTLFTLALASAGFALAQSSTSLEALKIPIGKTPPANDWQIAQQVGSSKGKLLVVTLDQPQRRQACRIQAFTLEKLVCSRAIGGPRTYLPQQVVALILPGDGGYRLRAILELNGGLGAAIWGTVVLAATCPACAAATAFVAFVLFSFAGAISYTDDQPERLLYLAPGQQLSGKFRFVEPLLVP